MIWRCSARDTLDYPSAQFKDTQRHSHTELHPFMCTHVRTEVDKYTFLQLPLELGSQWHLVLLIMCKPISMCSFKRLVDHVVIACNYAFKI
uniref:Uncharacterized protein n=1 Tax=Anguilla anguilla TaxID=7936 RepID=A0A0E9WM90_ANGAN